MLFLLLVVLLLTILFLVKNKIKANNENKPKLPPTPPKLPIIGNLHQLGSLTHQSLWKLSKTYGHIMGLQLGKVPAIVISSAKAAEDVLKINDLACCDRPSLTGPAKLAYNNIDITFSPYGEYWRQIRKLCVLKLFSSKSVQSFDFIRDDEIHSLNDFLRESSVSATPVNLSVKMATLMASNTFRTAFGKRFSECGLESEVFEQMIHRAMDVVGTFAASDMFPRMGWIIDRLTGVHAKFERSFREMDDFFEIVIAEHLNRTPEKGKEDLVDLLLSIERGEYDSTSTTQINFTRDCTKAVIMDIFTAGVDTGAITVTWAMSELAKNPRVMKKVQHEIRSYCLKKNKFKITESDINQLDYLKMVVKETLRLHPAAPILLRESISEFKVGEYQVSPKTVIQVNVWAIGRDPNYWPNSEEFIPERFIDSCVDFKGQNFEYLPFGAGRRGCPGMIMGLTMVELTLANLLCYFDWKLPIGMKESDIDMEEGSGITVFKKSPLKLVPVSYEWPSEVQT
uniref:Cytochrome P450 n=1 Tax=Cannabis sativa TaxID=3483 RepID=A0A803PH12_CANSA